MDCLTTREDRGVVTMWCTLISLCSLTYVSLIKTRSNLGKKAWDVTGIERHLEEKGEGDVAEI